MRRRRVSLKSPRSLACTCVQLGSFLSNGVDVRPYLGCIDDACYVTTQCSGSTPSALYPGSLWAPCTSPPSPPPAGYCTSDPLFPSQWYLLRSNTVQAWGQLGADPGTGTTLVIVDDGVLTSHADLVLDESASFAWTAEGSRVGHAQIPVTTPHGTACAGIVAATKDNGRGGCGMASGVRLLSSNLLGATLLLSDRTEVDHLDTFRNVADVLSNSWGPPDDLTPAYAFSATLTSALDRCRTEGRGGRGNILVFAGGNGGSVDNVNWDPYASHPFTIAVGSVGDDDRRTSFSEPGACLLLTAPSGGGMEGIVTTDLLVGSGYDDTGNHTATFSGTSASTPMVAAACALLLQTRPDLGWRDVHAILSTSARRNDPTDPSWQRNAAGIYFSEWYGFGTLDVLEAVRVAAEWSLLDAPEELSFSVSKRDDAPRATLLQFSVQDAREVDHARVAYSLVGKKGHVRIVLISPRGTASNLTSFVDHAEDFDIPATTALSYATRREVANGTWTLNVSTRDGYETTVNTATLTLSLVAVADSLSPPVPSAPTDSPSPPSLFPTVPSANLPTAPRSAPAPPSLEGLSFEDFVPMIATVSATAFLVLVVYIVLRARA